MGVPVRKKRSARAVEARVRRCMVGLLLLYWRWGLEGGMK